HTCLTGLPLFILCRCPHQLSCLLSMYPSVGFTSRPSLIFWFLILSSIVMPLILLRNFISVACILLFCAWVSTHDSHLKVSIGLYIVLKTFVLVLCEISFLLTKFLFMRWYPFNAFSILLLISIFCPPLSSIWTLRYLKWFTCSIFTSSSHWS